MWNKPRLLNAIADLLILSAAAAALAVALVWLVRVPSLPLRQVVFAQELQHTRRAEIEQSLPAVLKGNFFSLDLEAVRGELEKLPWIRKVELRRIWPARLKRYGDFVGNFKALDQKPVQVTLSPRLAWQLKLDNGMLVEMGREQQKSPVSTRLQRFIEVYPELVAKRATRPSVVDLRYPNGFAMRVAGDVKGK